MILIQIHEPSCPWAELSAHPFCIHSDANTITTGLKRPRLFRQGFPHSPRNKCETDHRFYYKMNFFVSEIHNIVYFKEMMATLVPPPKITIKPMVYSTRLNPAVLVTTIYIHDTFIGYEIDASLVAFSSLCIFDIYILHN